MLFFFHHGVSRSDARVTQALLRDVALIALLGNLKQINQKSQISEPLLLTL